MGSAAAGGRGTPGVEHRWGIDCAGHERGIARCGSLVGLIYLVFIIYSAVDTLRKGHILLFILGFLCGFAWILGLLTPDRRIRDNRPTSHPRQADQRFSSPPPLDGDPPVLLTVPLPLVPAAIVLGQPVQGFSGARPAPERHVGRQPDGAEQRDLALRQKGAWAAIIGTYG